jgi:N-acetylmuramoyl-L-alanine amidase
LDAVLRAGATGADVRELHERLSAIGYRSSDELGHFGERTVAVVEAFQRSKGLVITGEVDATTWNRLVEAGWRLGDRLLFVTTPPLRGDDVADLQVRLSQLGFDPGHIDGIFGPSTDVALREFQRNCGAEVSGALTRATLIELRRLSAGTSRLSVTEARDLAGFGDTSGPVILCGDKALVTALARELTATELGAAVLVVEDNVSATANDAGAALVISLDQLESRGVHLHYWLGYRTHSRRGEQLASAIATGLSSAHHVPPVEVTGMGLPVLRETRMTALHIEINTTSEQELRSTIVAMAHSLAQVFHKNT